MNDCRETIQSTTNSIPCIEVLSDCGIVSLTQDDDIIELVGKNNIQALYEILGKVLGKDKPL